MQLPALLMDMSPTNEQIAEQVRKIGKHLAEMEGYLLSVAFAQAQQYKLIASRAPGFSPEEDALLRSAAQQCLEGCNQLSALRKQFQSDVDAFAQH